MQLRTLFLFSILLGVFLYWSQEPALAQTDSATCSVYANSQLSTPTRGLSFEDCALDLVDNAPEINGYFFGAWSNYYVAVDSDDFEVFYYSAQRWRSAGTLDVREAIQPTSADLDGDGILNNDDQCVDSQETFNGVFDGDGCPDTIQDLLAFATNDINNYWIAEFEEGGLTYYEPTRVQAYRSNGRGSRNYNAFYSGSNHSIYYDLNLMEDSLEQRGDVAPVYILAHEFGHLVQANLGLLRNGRLTIQTELEADCLAGAYINNLNERELLDEGDADEGVRQAYAVGDFLPHTHEGAHGSPTQRAEAYALGFDNGPDICLTSFNEIPDHDH